MLYHHPEKHVTNPDTGGPLQLSTSGQWGRKWTVKEPWTIRESQIEQTYR